MRSLISSVASFSTTTGSKLWWGSRSTEGTLACGNPIIEAEKDGTDKTTRSSLYITLWGSILPLSLSFSK